MVMNRDMFTTDLSEELGCIGLEWDGSNVVIDSDIFDSFLPLEFQNVQASFGSGQVGLIHGQSFIESAIVLPTHIDSIEESSVNSFNQSETSRVSSEDHTDIISDDHSDSPESAIEVMSFNLSPMVHRGRSVESFPMLIHNAFNEGNIQDLYNLSYDFLRRDFRISVICPKSNYERQDSRFIAKFYDNLLASHPDGSFILRNLRTDVVGEHYLRIKSDLKFQGTQLFLGKRDRTGQRNLVTDYFDRKKMSKDRLRKWQQFEEAMITQRRSPEVFMKMEMTFFVDMTSNLIVKCVNKCRLTSFRVARINEND